MNQEISQHPKVNTIDAVFLNRKSLKIRYYCEDEGTEEPLIMLDVDSVKPILGNFLPRTTGSFISLEKFCAYVRKEIHFDKCWDYEYADCKCNLVEGRLIPLGLKLPVLPPSGCRRHFHHACSSCVNSWLLEYLRMIILHRESEPAFAMAAEEICCRVFISNDYMKYVNQVSPEFWLWIAQRWCLQGYLRDDLINTLLWTTSVSLLPVSLCKYFVRLLFVNVLNYFHLTISCLSFHNSLTP